MLRSSFVALVSVLVPAGAAFGSGGILPSGSAVDGRLIGDYGGDWWNWAVMEPAATNPLLDVTGDDAERNQLGWEGSLPVFFVGGTFGTNETRTFEVPFGKHLLVPLVNVASWVDGVNITTPEEAQQDARDLTALIDDLHFSLDGVPIPQAELFSHREQSSNFFTLAVPADNVLGLGPGVYPGAWSDGYYVMLEPLSPGLHVIEFGGGVSAFDFSVDVTDHLHVVPEPSSLALLGMGAVGLIGCGWRRRRRKTS